MHYVIAVTEHQIRSDADFILRASKVLNSTLDFDELLTRIVELTAEAVGAETGSLLLYDERRGGLVFEVALGEKGDLIKEFVVGPGQGVTGKVFESGEPAVVNDTQSYAAFSGTIDRKVGFETRSILCVPLLLRGRTIGVVEAINKSMGRLFDDQDLRMMRSLADLIAIAIDNSRLYLQARLERLENQSLLEVAKRVNSALKLDQVLQMIAESMHQVIHFDALAIYLVRPGTKHIDRLILNGFDEHQHDSVRLKVGEGIVGWCISNGESTLVADVSRDPRYVKARDETRSEIVAALFVGGRCIGAINLESNRLAAWDQHQLELLRAFAGQVSIAIEKAMLHQELLEKKELEQELNVAHRIQRTFLPRHQPVVPGYDVAGLNIPSEKVGGDYYDFIRIIDTQLGIVISDVSGKGIPAALIMASFRASLLAEIRNNFAIRTIMAKVGKLLRESIEPHHFVTALYGVLDIPNRVFTYANAGHNPAILIRADSSVKFLKDGGLPLCVLEQATYAEKRLQLRVGDLLVFYTDGVTEAFNEQEEEFGLERLIATLLAVYPLTAREIVGNVAQVIREFNGTASPSDDLTLVALKCVPV